MAEDYSTTRNLDINEICDYEHLNIKEEECLAEPLDQNLWDFANKNLSKEVLTYNSKITLSNNQLLHRVSTLCEVSNKEHISQLGNEERTCSKILKKKSERSLTRRAKNNAKKKLKEEDSDYSDVDSSEIFKKHSKKSSQLNTTKDEEAPYHCPVCDKGFSASSALNSHVVKRHNITLGNRFICHVCGANGSTRAALKRHLIRTHKHTEVDHPELLTRKCTHCTMSFSSPIHLYEHLRSIHPEHLSTYHQCQWCPALLGSRPSLLRHIKRSHAAQRETLNTEVCTYCPAKFASPYVLQKHLKQEHSDVLPTLHHECTVCMKEFKTRSMLKRHMMIHEKPSELRRKRYRYNCSICKREFCSQKRLDDHMEKTHINPIVRIYQCRICQQTFPTAKQNNRHYRRVHRKDRMKVYCGKCNITFDTAEEREAHRVVHPSYCHICNKVFLRRDSLREHLLIHSDPRHQCAHCDKKFTQRSNLIRHIRVHTGEKPYKCNHCNRSFSDKSACNSHERVHTGTERCSCDVCGASFSKKQRLTYHMRIHTGEGLLFCPLCMRANTNSYSLRKHVETHEVILAKAISNLGYKNKMECDNEFVGRLVQKLVQLTIENSTVSKNVNNKIVDMSLLDKNEHVVKGERDDNVNEEYKDINDFLETTLDSKEDVDTDVEVDVKSSENEDFILRQSVDSSKLDLPFSIETLVIAFEECERKKIKTKVKKVGSGSDSESICSSPDYSDFSDTEKPQTVSDDFVQQCLQVVISEDIEKSDSEYEDFKDKFRIPIYDEHFGENNGDVPCIKQEPLDESLVNYESQTSPPPLTPQIPKLKICKSSDYLGKDSFFVEIVKREVT